MIGQEKYQKIISEIVAQMKQVLGPDVVSAQLAVIEGVTLENDIVVLTEDAESQRILEKIIDALVQLIGSAAPLVLKPVMQNYNELKHLL